MSEVIDKKWYVVRAISGQENKIKTFIDNEVKRLNLSNFVEEVIVPTPVSYTHLTLPTNDLV